MRFTFNFNCVYLILISLLLSADPGLEDKKQARVTEHISTRTIEYISDLIFRGDDKLYNIDRLTDAFLIRAESRIILSKYELAIIDLDSVLSRNPDNWQAYFDMGKIFVLIEDHTLALPYLEVAIQNGISNPEIHLYRGISRYKSNVEDKGLFDLDFYILNKSSKTDDKLLFEAYYFRSILNLENGNIKQALSDISYAIELEPENPETYKIRGNLYRLLNQHDKAKQDLDKAISLGSIDKDIYFYRGLSNLNLDDKKDAISDFSRFLVLSHQSDQFRPQALLQRGIINFHLGEFEKASDDLNKTLEIDPSRLEAYGYRGMIQCINNRFEKALNDLNIGLQSNENNAMLYLYRGIASYQLGVDDRGLSDFDNFIIKAHHGMDDQFLFKAYYFRSTIYTANSKIDLAFSDISKAIEIDPNNPETYKVRGNLYRLLNQHDKAKNDLDKAIEMGSIDKDIYLYRGLSNIGLDENLHAVSDLSRFLILGHDSDQYRPQALLKRGIVNFHLEEYANAFEDINRSLELDASLSDAYGYRGMIYCIEEEYEIAYDDLDVGILSNEDNILLYLYRGLASFNLNINDSGFSDLDHYIQNIENSNTDELYQSYLYRGILLDRRGQYEASFSDLNTAISLIESPTSAYFYRGKINIILEEYELAIKDLDLIITHDSTILEAYLYRGIAMYFTSDYISSIEDLSHFIYKIPFSDIKKGLAFLYRAKSRFSSNELKKSMSDLNNAIEHNHELWDAYELRGKLHSQNKNYKSAILDLDISIQQELNNIDQYYYRGIALSNQLEFDKALIDLDYFISRASRNHSLLFDAYIERSEIYTHLDLFNDAMRDVNYAIEIEPDNPEGIFSRGKVWYKYVNYDECLIDFDLALSMGIMNHEIYLLRGITLNKLGEFKKSKSDLTTYIQKNTDYFNGKIDAHMYRGIANYKLGKYRTALKDLNYVVRVNPNRWTAYIQRGKVYWKLNKINNAMHDFNIAKDADILNLEDYLLVGQIYLEQNLFEEAFHSLSVYIHNTSLDDHDLSQAFYSRGLARFFQKDINSACIDWNHAAENGYKEAFSIIQKNCSEKKSENVMND